MTLWETIKMATYGLVSGAHLEPERDGIKSAYKSGSQQSVILFDIPSAQIFSGTLYLPMSSATFKIYSPDGTIAFDSNSHTVKHNQSLEGDPKHPWVLYFLPELFSEGKVGKWKIAVKYPIASKSGEIYLNVANYLVFKSEIKTDPYYRVVSDALNAAVKVTNNGTLPDKVTANVSITFPDKSQSHFVALDDGKGLDNHKSDSTFTVNETIQYQQIGLHVIETQVDIFYLGEVYRLQKLKNIWVTEQLASVNNVKVITESAQQGCIQEVKLIAEIHLKESGYYELLGMLEGSKHRYYGSSHTRFHHAAGNHQIEINYPKKALLSSFSKEDVISFAPLRVLKTDDENQHALGYNAYINKLTTIQESFKLEDLNFCREAIEIDEDFLISEEKRVGSDKVSALQLGFNVSVNHTGVYGYSVNFRHDGYVSSFGGRYHESQLIEGANQLIINIDASRLKEFKGGKVTAYFSIWKKNEGARLDKKLSTSTQTYQGSDFEEGP